MCPAGQARKTVHHPFWQVHLSCTLHYHIRGKEDSPHIWQESHSSNIPHPSTSRKYPAIRTCQLLADLCIRVTGLLQPKADPAPPPITALCSTEHLQNWSILTVVTKLSPTPFLHTAAKTKMLTEVWEVKEEHALGKPTTERGGR